MNTPAQVLLVGSNLALAAAVSFHVLKPSQAPLPALAPTPAPVVTPSVTIDLQPLLKPIESLDESVTRFSSTLQRFNTSVVQYDFLQKEIERLSRLDQALTMRVNLEQSKKPKEQTADTEKGIEQLKLLQGQVQKELERRRDTLLQLIAGLERELASTSIDEKAVREVLSDGPTPDAKESPAEPKTDAAKPEESPASPKLPVPDSGKDIPKSPERMKIKATGR